MTNRPNATIHEIGRGFPAEDDYVPGEGLLWRVVRIEPTIHSGGPGEGNWVYAVVESADWSDCDESAVFPAHVSENSRDTEDECAFHAGGGMGRPSTCTCED